jgi:N-acetylated-alpha-linked acidic dipeptidase
MTTTPPDDQTLRCFTPGRRAAQTEYESALNATPSAKRLRQWHDLLASEPHLAGTEGDARTIQRLIDAFAAMGLEVERHDIWAYLPFPVDAAVEIISPTRESLPVRETTLEEDPDSAHPDLPLGFTAYSGSGDVTGPIVYANYGTKEDFERLRELGIDVRSRIVIARYGKNFRGYKARFAEEAGAAALLIYTDPRDDGYMKGLPYPEGGWANETSIQRGSLLTLPQPGDPLMPGHEATEHARRLDPDQVALPRIPVQPIGWNAAGRIMARMTGCPLPQDLVETWQGGLPFAYRIEGGPSLRVRVLVKQDRRIARTANVVARLTGTDHPERLIVIGCHHDAWGFGAGDPLSGLIALLESARSFAEAAAAGRPSRRSILFAAWGAEEPGIIGSPEWCKAHRLELSEHGIAYINLDMAAMGGKFGAHAAPLLKQLIVDAAMLVPDATGKDGQSVHEAWTEQGEKDPSFGDLGGGSDHVTFCCHLGIPSCWVTAQGCHGFSYHSIYDTRRWYRQVVGDDYASALMVVRMTNLIAARLAEADVLPFDPPRYAVDARRHLEGLVRRAGELDVPADLNALNTSIDAYGETAASAWKAVIAALENDGLQGGDLAQINAGLLRLERNWLDERGLPNQPWNRSLFAATDPDSGYAAWMLPGLRGAIEERDPAALEEEKTRCRRAFSALTESMKIIAQTAREAGAGPRVAARTE